MAARDASLLLKSSPPHISKSFISRERLRWSHVTQSSEKVVAMIAPSGFGKTSQLVQWRKEASSQGCITLWYSIDNQDQPLRWARGLTESGLASCTSYGFSGEAVNSIRSCTDASDALINWLAEIAYISADILLILDDVHQLPTSTLTKALPFLLRNAPANLRIALTAHPHGALQAAGILAPEHTALLNATDLRLRLPETQKVLSATLGSDTPPDTAVKLHELTEGWPLGVQLGAAALGREYQPEAPFDKANADLRRYFLERVIDCLPTASVDFLVSLCRYGPIHPDFCKHVFQDPDAADRLKQLCDQTPLFLANETEGWVRFHPFARKVLTERSERQPEEQKRLLAERACQWYAENGMYEQAARQAFFIGDSDTALQLIERSTQELTEEGRSSVVLSWYERMTPQQLEKHPGFWAPVAWALAMSDRYAEVEALVKLILGQAELSTQLKFEASLIIATASSYAERFDLMAREREKWPQAPSGIKSGHLRIHAVVSASDCLYRGEPEKARLILRPVLDAAFEKWSPVTFGFAKQVEGLSYIWTGQYQLAEQVLRSAMQKVEAQLGRKNPSSCMLAALLAKACWELGEANEAALILADRVNIIERKGMPETLMTAYLVQARLAEHAQRQDQALATLESLRVIGQQRGFLRFEIAALCELARLHARHARSEIAAKTAEQMREKVSALKNTQPSSIGTWAELQLALALAEISLATDSLDASEHTEKYALQAMGHAKQLKRDGDYLECQLLLAKTRHNVKAGETSEAYSLAQAKGMSRLLEDYHGLVAIQKHHLAAGQVKNDEEASGSKESNVKVNGNIILTPKEGEVLLLLSNNMSNKEIARAMDIGFETVKWHIKNLSGKLQACNRKHAVARAKVLGLLSE